MCGFLMPGSLVSVRLLVLFVFVVLAFSLCCFHFIEFPFALLRDHVFLQTCWVALCDLQLVSFEGTNKLYVNFTYTALAARVEYSSELHTCLTSALDM